MLKYENINKLKIFGIVASIFSIIYIFLILQNRFPIAHTAAHNLQLQYTYFNEVVQHRSLPIWFPFTQSGTLGNYHFFPQLALLSPIFYLLGLFFKSINYLYLFYLAVWFEELVFLLGIVLLSSVYYKDPRTIFFVSITLIGASIWYPEIEYGIRAYYFIPIMLYCIHKCFVTRLFRYFIFFILFSTRAVHGQLYLGIFILFVVLVYMLFIALIYFKEIKIFLKRNTRLKNIAILLILLTIMFLSFYYIKCGDNEIVLLKQDRDTSGRTDLSTFLTFGGSIGPAKYKELFRRYGDNIDLTLYVGFFLLPFVFLSLLYGKKKPSIAVGVTALAIYLFSNGTWVSRFFYYYWPFGKYFRHIGLTAVVFKLFIVFYAGFGFDAFLERIDRDKKPIFLILISLMGVISLFIIKPYAITIKRFWFVSDIERIIFLVAPYLILGGGILLLYLMFKRKIKKDYLVNLLLLLVVCDLVVYKYSLIAARMPRGVSNKVISLFKPYKYDFPKQRSLDLRSYIKNNERIAALEYQDYVLEGDSVGIGFLPKYYRGGGVYNTIESFFYIDSAKSYHYRSFVLRADKDYFDVKRDFPNNNGAYEKYSGIDYPKLQVFFYLNLVEDETAMGKVFNLANFTGDMLFATEEDIKGKQDYIPTNLIGTQDIADFENRNERIASDIKVERFSSNMLKLKVTTPDSPTKHCFLYYSDIYHPHWNAYVDGRYIPVIRSNIGYKSVMIPCGTSEVVFRFGNVFYSLSIFCTLALSIAVLYPIFYLLKNDLIKGEMP